MATFDSAADPIKANQGFFIRLKYQLQKRFYCFFVHPLKISYTNNPIEFVGLAALLLPLLILPFWVILILIIGMMAIVPSSTLTLIFIVGFGISIISMYVGILITNPRRMRQLQGRAQVDNSAEVDNQDSPDLHPNLFPLEIQKSLKQFKRDYPDPKRVAFIMMRFEETPEHQEIFDTIRTVLMKNGVYGLRADTLSYHDDLYYNILTYLHGCGFGIAVFETIQDPQYEDPKYNPNVAFEVGYLKALGKPVCLLKEKSLKTLPTDLIGKTYSQFDMEKCDTTINFQLNEWLVSKHLTNVTR